MTGLVAAVALSASFEAVGAAAAGGEAPTPPTLVADGEKDGSSWQKENGWTN